MRKKGMLGDYVPVTMDELMARFVVSMEREACQSRFADSTKVILHQNLDKVHQNKVKAAVNSSFTALQDLIKCNTVDVQRYPNRESQGYLRLIEKM